MSAIFITPGRIDDQPTLGCQKMINTIECATLVPLLLEINKTGTCPAAKISIDPNAGFLTAFNHTSNLKTPVGPFFSLILANRVPQKPRPAIANFI